MRGLGFVYDGNNAPLTRLYYALDEATTAQAAGADGGRASDVTTLTYVSKGDGGAWKQVGGDADYFHVEGSLTSSSGPWTDLASSSLTDTGGAGDTLTLYLRAVSKRWGSPTSPRLDFEVRLRYLGAAGVTDA